MKRSRRGNLKQAWAHRFTGGVMVQYLASVSNEISITVRSVQVNTTLILSGPAEATQGQPFTLSATLKRNDTGAVISGASVKFLVGSTLLGSAVTGASGAASFTVTMTGSGVYRFTAAFEGAEYEGLSLMPSMGSYAVGLESALPLLIALGAAYLLLKR